jgi:hypothetical protein
MKRFILVPLAMLAVIVGGLYLWRAFRAPFDALEQELRALKETGEPLRYEDIVPPVPANLNAAPIYRKAFGLLSNLSFNELQVLDEFRNGRPVEVARVRQILKRCQPALALAKKASKLPHARWINWQPNSLSIQFPHLLKLREIARLLVADALLRLHDGDVEGSTENLIALLRMAHQMSEEPFAENLTLSRVIFRLANQVLQAALSRQVKISPAQIRQLQHLSSQWDGDQLLVRHHQLMLVAFIDFFDWLRANPTTAREYLQNWSECCMFGCIVYPKGNLAVWVLPLHSQLASNEVILLRYHRRLLSIARKGEPYDWKQFELIDRWAQRTTSYGFKSSRFEFAFLPLSFAREFTCPGDLFEGIVSGSLFRVIATAKALQRIFQVSLALHMFWQERDRYPESLSVLVPQYLPAVPKDPFDGKPLRYRLDSNGFRLWSIGKDLKDNGGVRPDDVALSVSFR